MLSFAWKDALPNNLFPIPIKSSPRKHLSCWIHSTSGTRKRLESEGDWGVIPELAEAGQEMIVSMIQIRQDPVHIPEDVFDRGWIHNHFFILSWAVTGK